MSKQRIYILVAAIIGAISTFLPWAKGPMGMTIDGTQGDGYISLAVFVAVGVVAFLGTRTETLSKVQKWSEVALGAVATLVAIFEFVNISNMKNSMTGLAKLVSASVSPSFGLFTLLLAGIAVIILPLLGNITDK